MKVQAVVNGMALLIHFAKRKTSCTFLFNSLPKGSGLDQWFENQALSEAVSSVNVDQVDLHNPSIQEILEASRLNKNKDILQLLGKGPLDVKWLILNFQVVSFLLSQSSNLYYHEETLILQNYVA